MHVYYKIQKFLKIPIPLFLKKLLKTYYGKNNLDKKLKKFLNYKKGSFPETEKQASEILTIPIHQNLNKSNLNWIVKCLNNFNIK